MNLRFTQLIKLAIRENARIYLHKPKEDSAISLEDSSLEIESTETHDADASVLYRYWDLILLLRLSLFNFFIKVKLNIRSGNENKKFHIVRIACLMNENLTSSK